MVGDVCTVVVTSVTVGLVVLTDTVVGSWVDVLTSGEVVVDCTEVGVCVTTVVPVVGDVCSVVVTSVIVGLVVLTDTVVGPLVDVLTSGEVVDCTEVGGCVTTVVPVIGDVCSVVVTSVTVGLVVLTDTVGCFGVVVELTVVVPIYTIQLKFVRKLKRTYNPARAGRDLFH